MNYKPLIIVLGESQSTFTEIIFKSFKSKFIKKYKTPLVFIGSKELIVSQMKKLRFNVKINLLNDDLNNYTKLNNLKLNLIDINYKFKKPFENLSTKSRKYISNSFNKSLEILKKKQAIGLINGPVSKKHFLNKSTPGITEYLQKKTKSIESVMVIYNKNISVTPITTHIPVKKISINLTKKKIVNKIKILNKFYLNIFKKKPKFAILSLNPHCESNEKKSEEQSIIIPAIRVLKNNKILIKGPFPADTFFLKKNIDKYDNVIGMYHDQVLSPIKTLYNFDAVNITLGLPFFRLSPDHGPNHLFLGKNKSDISSFISCLDFFKNVKKA